MTAPQAETVKERPIIFSAAMVRAILDGRKTQTRRVMKPQPEVGIAVNCTVCHRSKKPWGRDAAPAAANVFCDYDCEGYLADTNPPDLWSGESRADFGYPEGWEGPCPYGQPGDRLWVRETWTHEDESCEDHRCGQPTHIYYRCGESYPESLTWRPSIFMPRWASRILLEVVRVQMEELQEISDLDALAEGIQGFPIPDNSRTHYGLTVADCWERNPGAAFERLWDSINAKRGHGWENNPWVWVVEFKRLEP